MFGFGKPDVNIPEYAGSMDERTAITDILGQHKGVLDIVLSCAKIALPFKQVEGMKTLVDSASGIMREFAGVRLEKKASPVLQETVLVCAEAVKKGIALKSSNFIEKLTYLVLVKMAYPKEKASDMFEKGRYEAVKKTLSRHTSERYVTMSHVLMLKRGSETLEKALAAAKGQK